VNNATDIRIVDLAVEMTTPSSRGSKKRHVHFRLSGIPPPGWNETFKATLRGVLWDMRREAWNDRGYVVVDCLVDEIDLVLQHLRLVVKETNRRYDAEVAQGVRREESAQDLAADEIARLEAMRRRLRFDPTPG